MSQETLRAVMDRLNSDKGFRDKLHNDWQNALDDLDLSPAEIAALASQDEDALRRLGADTKAMSAGAGFFGTWVLCSLACIFTIDTRGSTRDTCPGSKKGCGTHNTHNCFVMFR